MTYGPSPSIWDSANKHFSAVLSTALGLVRRVMGVGGGKEQPLPQGAIGQEGATCISPTLHIAQSPTLSGRAQAEYAEGWQGAAFSGHSYGQARAGGLGAEEKRRAGVGNDSYGGEEGGPGSFILQVFIEHLLCARPGLGVGTQW